MRFNSIYSNRVCECYECAGLIDIDEEIIFTEGGEACHADCIAEQCDICDKWYDAVERRNGQDM